MKTIRIATRNSPLALWQANETRARLDASGPKGRTHELVEIRTLGDRDRNTSLASLGDTGVFTKEVDRAILDGRAECAVHSLKDQETTLTEGLVLGAVLPRGPVEDVLLFPKGSERSSLEHLAAGERVATGSLRRQAQLLNHRPDLQVVGIRGNVDGRIRQLDEGHAEALLMARAGMVRLGLEERIDEVLEFALMLPAPSQGIVGITCREDDEETIAALRAIDDAATHAAALAERALLRGMDGGCNVPVGAFALVGEDRLQLTARVLSPDGKEVLEATLAGECADAQGVGERLSAVLVERGAREITRGRP